MKTRHILISAIAILLAGCSREIDSNLYIVGEFSFNASSADNDTKTVLQNDGSIFWSPSDCINVYYGDKSGKFTSTNTEATSSAEFTGTLGPFVMDGSKEFYAAYPYSEGNSYSDNSITLTLPSEQTAVEGTFGDDLFLSVAKSGDFSLHFYNVCGGVKFSLLRDDIKKVVFKGNDGEPLSGRITVELGSGGIPIDESIATGSTSVTLYAPDGDTFKSGAWYYIVLAPQGLSKGYTMELYTDTLADTISSDSPVNIRRSVWGVLKDLAEDTPMEFEAIDLGLSVKWANMNLGSGKPTERGDYFAWGETVPYYEDGYSQSSSPVWRSGKNAGYDWASYSWSEGSDNTLTRYCFDSSLGYNGYTDNKIILDPSDDAAHSLLGSDWRMPTDEEMTELRQECSWKWTTREGTSGYDVTGPNGGTIFIPAAEAREGTDFDPSGASGFYWSSSLHDGTANCALAVTFRESGVFRNGFLRILGMSIRPVYGKATVPVESVSLDKTTLELSVGQTATLTATVLPENATDKTISWSSSDESIVTVSGNGTVKALSEGSATISVTTSDGGLTARCEVTVAEPSSTEVPESIDLGLSVNWGSFNLGATSPEESGDYYAWGETEPYYRSLSSLDWKEGKEAGYEWPSYKYCDTSDFLKPMTKYCTNPDYGLDGFTDGKEVLEAEDDAAVKKLGGNWRMPTKEEFSELHNNCTWVWESVNGVDGYTVTGPSGNSIFFPAVGTMNGKTIGGRGSSTAVWSSSVDSSAPSNAWALSLVKISGQSSGRYSRCGGFPIRPVCSK